MLMIKLVILGILILQGVNGTNKGPSVDKRLPPSQAFPFPFSSSSEEKGTKSGYSYWELSMFSQILMDISLNRCPQLLPDTTQEFRTYINGILEQAPPHKEVRSSFMQMWNGLVKCFRLSTESLSRANQGKDMRNKQIRFITDLLPKTRRVMEWNGSKLNKGFLEDANDYPSTVIPHDEDYSFNPYPITNLFSPPSPKRQKLVKKAKMGVLNTVGNLITKLSDAPIFPSIISESKKLGSNSEGEKITTRGENGELSPNESKEQQFYSNTRSSYTKQVYNRILDDQFLEAYGLEPSAYAKRTKPKVKTLENFRHRTFVKNGENHFRSLFKSMVQVVKKSCPVQGEPHGAMMRSVLMDILYYLKEDSERRGTQGEERDKFHLNLSWQKKLKQCSDVVRKVG